MAGRLRLRPLARDDEAELLRIHATPEVARWWDEPEEGFPFSDDPDATRLVIEVDGRVGGMIQYAEELTPKYRHASIDLFLDPALHNQGHGSEAVRQVVRLLIDERGQDGRGWHDGLLMELLAGEEAAAPDAGRPVN